MQGRSEGGRRVTLTAAEAEWADGEPFTAEDVCFTIDALHDPNNPIGPLMAPVRDEIRGCTVLDDGRTFELELALPAGTYVQSHLMFPILPKHAFESTTIPVDHPFARHAFGPTGMVADLDRRGVHAYAADPEAERPLIKRFEWRPLRNQADAVADVLAGRAHGIVSVQPEYFQEFARSDGVALKSYFVQRTWFVDLPQTRLGADPRVREALDAVVDRIALRTTVVGNDPNDDNPPAEPISGPFVQSSPNYNRAIKPMRADTEHAARRLFEAGWEYEDGTWQLDGKPVEAVIGITEVDDARQPHLAEALSAQLSAFGIATTIRIVTPHHATEVDLLVRSWSWTKPERPQDLYGAGASGNWVPMNDPILDALVAEAAVATDYTGTDAWHAVHTHLAETHAQLFLLSINEKSAWRIDVRNNTIAPSTYWTAFGDWRLEAPVTRADP